MDFPNEFISIRFLSNYFQRKMNDFDIFSMHQCAAL